MQSRQNYEDISQIRQSMSALYEQNHVAKQMRGVDISSITAPNQGPGDMAGQKRARTPDDVKNKTVQNVNIPHDTTTGFENLLGQTNMFTMDSQNMSLGASNNNIMPNLLVGHNNHTILDKERQPKKENVDEQQIKWEAAE